MKSLPDLRALPNLKFSRCVCASRTAGRFRRPWRSERTISGRGQGGQEIREEYGEEPEAGEDLMTNIQKVIVKSILPGLQWRPGLLEIAVWPRALAGQ
ncbi:hypothetical protein RCIA200 [Methanocella arvoryzae MRE50]|uniref:Uncharacterized protein n=1 Tax=Methanocella arvoryzae (strain DSM 22066 / NBRC 105507 / MRE50) TaxID=351160 RepID=Q0W1L6_METAR|nr:hypothetical protein RCIA200 [Methanocella arvoryzae MRE50]